MIGHETHQPDLLTNTQAPAKFAVGWWVYWTKDRKDKGELTGMKLYISEAKYHPPTKPRPHYADDKWTYLLKEGPGEKALDVGWAEEGDLRPEFPNRPPNLMDA